MTNKPWNDINNPNTSKLTNNMIEREKEFPRGGGGDPLKSISLVRESCMLWSFWLDAHMMGPIQGLHNSGNPTCIPGVYVGYSRRKLRSKSKYMHFATCRTDWDPRFLDSRETVPYRCRVSITYPCLFLALFSYGYKVGPISVKILYVDPRGSYDGAMSVQVCRRLR